MPTIRQLSPSIINKIAAGEVIERPASVVKELLENSIDAGATRIELMIESGGLEMIRISDNGCGIAADELPLAIASHATSKLQTADDLFDVHSLGFRGEALASIAEVSHLTLRSRVPTEEAGAELQVRGGQSDPIVPVGMAVGTVMEVRHLFFNTPVRRKFLRSPQTETSHVVEAFTRIALAYPHVHMTMHSGSRQLFDLPATHNLIERIGKFFGSEISDSLISVESEHEAIRLSGFVTDPAVSRSNNRMQYLFLNGRHIRDRSLQHALSEAYRGLLMVGRFPVCFLRLEMPAQLVDVNVHPTKLEVRFQEGGKIYSQLLQTLRHRFLSTDLTARVRASDIPGSAASGSSSDASYAPPPSRDDARWEAYADRLSAGLSGGGAAAASPGGASPDASGAGTARLPFPNSVPEFRPFPATGLGVPLGATPSLGGAAGTAGHDSTAAAGAWNAQAAAGAAPGWAPPTALERPALPEGAQMWNPDAVSAAEGLSAGSDAPAAAQTHRIDAAHAATPSVSHL
ncbi:MAG: DNA mismatch repair endonuclease MutL, partial [Aureliella sp.]